MRILAPLSSYKEISSLIHAGADEFYCGIIPQQALYKDINCHASDLSSNFSSYQELCRSINLIHKKKKKIFVTLNVPFIAWEQNPDIERTINSIIEQGIDAVIVSDIGLLYYLNERYPQLEVHLSIIAGVTNMYAIDFFRELGVKRIVLPDHLTLSEIENIAGKNQDISLEIFVLNNKCFNWESVCGFHHWVNDHNPKPPIPIDFIKKALSHTPQQMLKTILASSVIQKIFEWGLASQKHLHGCKLNYTVSAGEHSHEKRYIDQKNKIQQYFQPYSFLRRMNQCGACSLFFAEQYGINAVKIDGRYFPLKKKMRDIVFVRNCYEQINSISDAAHFSYFCKKQFKKTYGYPCREEQCYYPEQFQKYD